MSIEAPNSHRFQPITKQHQPSLIDIGHFHSEFNVASTHLKEDITPKPTLHHLKWLETTNDHSEQIYRHFSDELKNNPNKTLIKLTNIQSKSANVAPFLKFLQQKPQIQHLIIRHSTLSQNHIDHIEALLKRNDGIAWLVLDHNKIDDKSIDPIAESLKQNKGVIHVVLNDNQIGTHGANALASMLRNNQNIQSLFLQNNQLTNNGAMSIISAIRAHPSIKTVDLRNNHLSDRLKQQFLIEFSNHPIQLYI